MAELCSAPTVDMTWPAATPAYVPPPRLNSTGPGVQLDPGTAAPLDPGPPVIASPASSAGASCNAGGGVGFGLLALARLVLRRRRR